MQINFKNSYANPLCFGILYIDGKAVTEAKITTATKISNYAFCSYDALTSITFNGTIEQWNTVSKKLYWEQDVSVTKVICLDGEVAI